jgi:hypothetical protein
MVQPNPEARLRRLKPRGSEEHRPLVDPQTPPSDVVLHGVYLGSSLLRGYTFHRPKRRQEESEMEHKDKISITSRYLPKSL